MNPARILIVEDETVVSLDVQDRLITLGYNVTGVLSRGEDALAQVAANRPDLVLMDIGLKGAMDGIAAAEQIRQRWRLPVVYLTAYSEDTTIQRAKLTEPFGYLIKPFEDREIKSVIEMALYKHQAEEERLEMERRLLHAQKLESLGVLAGGIAHDFNNLLTAILGNIELAMADVSELSPARDSLREASQATRRAADLTRQMLAYSGRGKFVIKELDLTELVEEMAHLLKVSISKTATLHLHVKHSLPRIRADVTQMQQIVMNLLTNASEAIGERVGSITITTGVRECDEASLASSRLTGKAPPGCYVFLEVADTGCGMDETVQQRLFDPFFSTKFTGRGLGMSAVLGVVRGHQGAILVSSQVGCGTTIRVLFPASPASVSAAAPDRADQLAPSSPPPAPALAGTVLVVDDEAPIRKLLQRVLTRIGLRVLCAADGEEAIRIFREEADVVVCVVLDLTMPKLDGMQTYAELRRIRPDVPVFLASGFEEHELSRRFTGQGLAGFIQKPYQLDLLVQAIRQACATPPRP